MRKATIVLPTYNEAKNVEKLMGQIFAVTSTLKDWDIDLLVVDSKSPDGTSAVVKKLQRDFKKLHLLETDKEGLGKAYVRGFTYAIEKLDAYVVLEMDADLQHNPQVIPQFLKTIENGADFVIGSRYIKGGSIPKDWGFQRKFFSIVGNLIIRLGFMKLKIADWTSGYRAIKAWVIKEGLTNVEKYSGYVFQVALLDTALKYGAKVKEIPIQFVERIYGESKINSSQFIWQTLFYVFTYSSFMKYAIVGVIGAVVDFGISFVIIELFRIHRNLYWLATLISAEATVISNFLLNNFWSFSHKKLEAKLYIYLPKFFKFNLIAAGGLAIQAVGIQLLTNVFGPQWWYVYKFLILALVIIPYSYILYNKVIWKEKK